jgi:SAM-dependent methyltransferase
MINRKIYFLEQFAKSIENNTFCKLTLSKNVGAETDLKNIFIKPVKIKNDDKLSFTYRYKTKDIVKNYSKNEAKEKLVEYINVNYFTIVNFISDTQTNQLIIDKNGKVKLNSSKSVQKANISNNHDHEKVRKIDSKGKYLFDLKITDVNGVVFKTTQDKFKQINHYVELLAPLLKEIPKYDQLNVVDMGSGKGYLTFALYDYLTNVAKLKTKITGVEFRKDLVELCNKISVDSGFDGLKFTEGTIADYEGKPNILIALHACDTATDDAIFKGITSEADLIVVAPCCHKQIRREMEAGKAKNELAFLTNHGIFMERQAEMVTDGLRALILEYFGYKTKVFQFISDAHTPKNVMITAVRNQKSEVRNLKLEIRKNEILEKLKNIKAFFGIKRHYLEKLLAI